MPNTGALQAAPPDHHFAALQQFSVVKVETSVQFLSFAASLQQIGNKQETCPVLCPVLGRQWGPHQPEFLSAGSCKGPATDFGSLYLPEISYISWNSSIRTGWINTHPKESRQVTKCCPPKPKVHLPASSQKENCLKGHHWSHFLVISST